MAEREQIEQDLKEQLLVVQGEKEQAEDERNRWRREAEGIRGEMERVLEDNRRLLKSVRKDRSPVTASQ